MEFCNFFSFCDVCSADCRSVCFKKSRVYPIFFIHYWGSRVGELVRALACFIRSRFIDSALYVR